jgi:hypothetical protein
MEGTAVRRVWLRVAAGAVALLLFLGLGAADAGKMRGLLVFGHEARSLQPCGGDRAYWLDVSGVQSERLEVQYRRLVTGSYDPVYAELDGEFVSQPDSGSAADYDGAIAVREILEVSRGGIEACRAGEPMVAPDSKIRFDLDRINADGLQGPPDGLRALHYEYCIPDRPDAVESVAVIDPTLQIQRGSPGRVGCGPDQLLCLGHSHQSDPRSVLGRLAFLTFVGEIREAFFE